MLQSEKSMSYWRFFPLSCGNFPCPNGDPNHGCWELLILHSLILGWVAAMILIPQKHFNLTDSHQFQWRIGLWVGIHPLKPGTMKTVLGMFHPALDVLVLGGDMIRSHCGVTKHNACVWVMLAGTRQTCPVQELQDPCPEHSGIIPLIRNYHQLSSPLGWYLQYWWWMCLSVNSLCKIGGFFWVEMGNLYTCVSLS